MIIRVSTTFRERKSRKDEEEQDGYWEPIKSDKEFKNLTKILDNAGIRNLEYTTAQ